MSTILAIFPLCLSVSCGDLAVVLPGRLLPSPAAPVVHLVDSLAPLLHVPPDAVHVERLHLESDLTTFLSQLNIYSLK